MAVNLSKVTDARMWARWEASGAIGRSEVSPAKDVAARGGSIPSEVIFPLRKGEVEMPEKPVDGTDALLAVARLAASMREERQETQAGRLYNTILGRLSKGMNFEDRLRIDLFLKDLFDAIKEELVSKPQTTTSFTCKGERLLQKVKDSDGYADLVLAAIKFSDKGLCNLVDEVRTELKLIPEDQRNLY